MSNTNETKSRVKLPDEKVSLEITEAFDNPDSISIGQMFMEARAQKGLTQDQASKSLKVRTKIITAFEEGEDLELPGLAYKIGFVRSYANLVDLDSDYCVEIYKSSINNEKEKVSYNFLKIKKEKKSYYPMISLSLFLFLLIGYSAWYYNDINSSMGINPSPTASIEESVKKKQFDYVKVEDQSLIVGEKKTFEEKALNDAQSQKDSKFVEFEAENKEIKKVTVAVNNEKVIEEENMVAKKNISNIDKTNEVSAIANERDPETEMVLKSKGNSWVEIEDLDGNSLITRLMRPGETYVVPKTKGLTLSTGNAGVLSLTYGNTFIPSLGEVGEVISARPLNIEAFNQR